MSTYLAVADEKDPVTQLMYSVMHTQQHQFDLAEACIGKSRMLIDRGIFTLLHMTLLTVCFTTY